MCSKTHPGPKITPKTPQEGQNWPQCTSCGPINWFWAKKNKFESVRSKVCSFHSESALYYYSVLLVQYAERTTPADAHSFKNLNKFSQVDWIGHILLLFIPHIFHILYWLGPSIWYFCFVLIAQYTPAAFHSKGDKVQCNKNCDPLLIIFFLLLVVLNTLQKTHFLIILKTPSSMDVCCK